MEDPQPQENVSGAPEYLNILVGNAPLAMAMFDREMRYLVANDLWIEEFHLEEIPIHGASHYEIFPDLHESWREVYERCLEGHVERCEEDIFQRPDGSRDWVRWEVRPWRHQEGEIGGLIISCEVVTERKRAEQRTQFEKDFTEGLLAGASPVVVVDLEGRIGRSSEGARELSVGKGIDDGETYFWDAFSDEADRGEIEQSFRSEIERSGENGTFSYPHSTVTEFTDKEGNRRKITWTNTAQKNDLGEVDRIIQIGFATELGKEVEESVEESRGETAEGGEAEGEETVEAETTEMAEAEPTEAAEAEAREVEGPTGAEADKGDEEAGDGMEMETSEAPEEGISKEGGEEEEPAVAASDTGASLRELAEKVRAARGAAAERNMTKATAVDSDEGAEGEGFDFLVGQPFAPDEEGRDPEAKDGELAGETDEGPEAVPEDQGDQAAGGESDDGEVESEPDDLEAGEELDEDELGEEESAKELVAEAVEAQEVVSVTGDESEVQEDETGLGEAMAGSDSEGSEEEQAGETMIDEEAGGEEEGEEEDKGEIESEVSEAEETAERGQASSVEAADLTGAKPVEAFSAPSLEESGSKAKHLISELVDLIGRLESEVEERKAAVVVPPPPMVSSMPPPPPPPLPAAPGAGKTLDGTDEEPWPEAGTPPPGEESDPEGEEGAAPDEPSAYEQAAEHLPFGLLLLDEELEVVYANPRLERILGFGIDEESGVEGWIRRGCPDEQYAEEVVTEWRNAVWRRQLTKIYTLSNDEGALREVEFRPNLLDDGRLLLTVLDVTDSRRSEEALRASEAKFRALFQDSGVGIALVDRTGDIFDVNPAMEILLDAKRVDLRMEAFSDHVFHDDLAAVHGAVGEIMEGGKRAAEITARLGAEGVNPVWTRLNIVVVRDPDGDPMFTAYFAHDITEQRKATAELEESQEQNRALLEATPDLLFLIDKKGIVEDYICSLDFPITVGEEVVGSDLRAVVPQLRTTLDGQLEEVALSNTVVKSFFSAGGHKFETRLVQSGDDHRVLVLRDQTEALSRRESPRRNPGAFESMGEAVLTADREGKVTDWNGKAEALFGVSRQDALGHPVATFYGMDATEEFWNALRSAVEADGIWAAERLAFSRRDGTTGECSVELRPLDFDETGRPTSLIGVHCDLEVEEEQMAEIPSGMLAPEAVYQKIANNLQIIYSLLNLQVNTLEDPDARATLMSSQNRVRAISFVHQQLRDHDGMQQVDFAGFVDMLAEHLRGIYETPPDQVGVRIGFSDIFLPLEPSIPLALVLNELVSNAFWHGFDEGSKGEVGIDLKVDGSEGWLVVRDTGVGLPEGDFEEMKGLGLHIATTLAQQVGGTLAPVTGPDTAIEVRFRI